MTPTSKITTRLRPDVDRRLRAAAALARTRISTVINQALDDALPGLPELGAMLTRPPEDGTGSARNSTATPLAGGTGAAPVGGHSEEGHGDDEHA